MCVQILAKLKMELKEMAWGLDADTRGHLQSTRDTADPRVTSYDLGESWGKDGKVRRICMFS